MSIEVKERPCWFRPEEIVSNSFGQGQRIGKVRCFQSVATNWMDDRPCLIVTDKHTVGYHGEGINRNSKVISRAAVNLPDRIIGRKITFIFLDDEPMHP